MTTESDTRTPNHSPLQLVEPGTIGRLPDVLPDGQRICFVVDQIALDASGVEPRVNRAFQGRSVFRFSDFEPNPTVDAIDLANQRLDDAFDTVVAFGGGTAIDIAKMIALTAGRSTSCHNLLDDPSSIGPDRPCLIAIPTTAGTGSEATHFAVVYADGVKHSIAHPLVKPDVALVDAHLTHELPPTTTAHSGLDALCQAIESLWSVQATKQSCDFATRSLRLSASHLPSAVRHPTPADRAAMAEAANLAGKAIDLSFTTGAHALSYTLTSSFGVPHGLAVALTIPAWLRYNGATVESNCIDPRGLPHLRRQLDVVCEIFGVRSSDEAADWVTDLLDRLGCPGRLSDVGVARSDLPEIAGSVNVQRLSNNPHRVTDSVLQTLLEESL